MSESFTTQERTTLFHHEETMIELLEKRIKELEAELEQLVQEANRQIGMKQGAIAELKRLLNEQDKEN